VAVNITALTSGVGTGNTHATASVSPVAGSGVILVLGSAANTGSTPAAPSAALWTISGLGLTWTQVATVSWSTNRRLLVYVGTGIVGSGSISITFNGGTYVLNELGWLVHQVTGLDHTTPVKGTVGVWADTNNTGTSTGASLAVATAVAGDATFSAVQLGANQTNISTYKEAAYTFLNNANGTLQGRQVAAAYLPQVGNGDKQCTWNWATGGTSCGSGTINLVLAASGTPSTVAATPLTVGTAIPGAVTVDKNTLAIHPSTPAIAQSTTASPTTVSFSPPGGSMLVAMVAGDGVANTAKTWTVSSTPSLLWGRLVNATYPEGPNASGGADLWYAITSANAVPTTVTAAPSATGLPSDLQVVVFSGANTTPGNVGEQSYAATTGAVSAPLTVGTSGSFGIACSADWGAEAVATPGAGQTLISGVRHAGQFTSSFWRTTNTVSAGATSMSTTAPTGTPARDVHVLAFEVRPAVSNTVLAADPLTAGCTFPAPTLGTAAPPQVRAGTHTYAGIASGTASPWSITATLPTVQDGDLVVAGLSTSVDTGQMGATPAGWTRILLSADDDRAIYQKIWHTGDPTTVTFTWGRASGAPKALVVLASFYSVDQTTPVAASAFVNGTASASIPYTGVTATTNDSRLVSMYLARDNGTTGTISSISMAGFDLVVSAFYSSGGGIGTDGWIGSSTAVVPAGATGTQTLSIAKTAGLTDDAFNGVLLALNPVAGAPSSPGYIAPDILQSKTTYPTPTVSTITTGAGRFPGDIAEGHLRVGAYTVNGVITPSQDLWPDFVGQQNLVAYVNVTGTPTTRFETAKTMGIRRNFYRDRYTAGQTWAELVSDATSEIAAGRLPWQSIKFDSAEWANVGTGSRDTDIDWLINQLKVLPGPVWMTINHEPENDGQLARAAGWRAMQSRFRQRLTLAGATNIAFAPIYMDWSFDPTNTNCPYHPTSPLSGPTATFDVDYNWWVDGIWDFFGIDHYITNPNDSDITNTKWNNWKNFAASKGLDVGIGEYADHDPVNGATEMQAAHTEMLSYTGNGTGRILAICFFDGTGGLAVSAFPDANSQYLQSYTPGDPNADPPIPNTNPVYALPTVRFNTTGRDKWRELIGLSTSLLITEDGFPEGGPNVTPTPLAAGASFSLTPTLISGGKVSPTALAAGASFTLTPTLKGAGRVSASTLGTSATTPLASTFTSSTVPNGVTFSTAPMQDAYYRWYLYLPTLAATDIFVIEDAANNVLHRFRVTAAGALQVVGDRDGATNVIETSANGIIEANKWYGIAGGILHSTYSMTYKVVDTSNSTTVLDRTAGVTIPGTGSLANMSEFAFVLSSGITGYTAGHAVSDQALDLIAQDSRVSPEVLLATTQHYPASTFTEARVSADALAATTAIGVGTSTIGVGTVSASTLAASASFSLAPTLTGNGRVNLISGLETRATIPTPGVNGDTIKAATPLLAGASFSLAPTLIWGGKVEPFVLGSRCLPLPAPTLISGGVVSVPSLDTEVALPNLLLTGGIVDVWHPAQPVTGQFYSPSPDLFGSGKVSPTPLAASASFALTPTLVSAGRVQPSVLATAASFTLTPTLVSGGRVSVSLAVQTTYPDPTLSTGAVAGYAPATALTSSASFALTPTLVGTGRAEPAALSASASFALTPTLVSGGRVAASLATQTTYPAPSLSTSATPGYAPASPVAASASFALTPTLVGAGRAEPAVLAASASFALTPTLAGGGRVAASLATQTTYPAPTLSTITNTWHPADPLTAATALPAAATVGGGKPQIATLSTLAGVPGVTLTSGGRAEPSSLAVVLTAPAPTLTGPGRVSISTALGATTYIPDVSFTGGGRVDLFSHLATTATLPEVSTTGVGRVTIVTPLSASASMPNPSVDGGIIHPAASFAAGATFVAPTLLWGGRVDPAALEATTALPAATTTGGGRVGLLVSLEIGASIPGVTFIGDGRMAPTVLAAAVGGLEAGLTLKGVGIVTGSLAASVGIPAAELKGNGRTEPLALTAGSTLAGHSGIGGGRPAVDYFIGTVQIPLPALISGTVLLMTALHTEMYAPPVGMNGSTIVDQFPFTVGTGFGSEQLISGTIVDADELMVQTSYGVPVLVGVGAMQPSPLTVPVSVASAATIDHISTPVPAVRVGKKASSTWRANVSGLSPWTQDSPDEE
jgi:hypothetical protein